MLATIAAVAGTDEAGIRVAVRATARTSVVLFTAAFVASPLARRWPGPATRWLLANRRYFGVSFAVSHLAHLLALLALAGWSGRRMVAAAGVPVLVLGGIGYAFVAAMTATSFDRTAAWLGPRRWHHLHTAGVWYLWTVFLVSFAPRIAESALYGPFVVLLAAAAALRWRTRRLTRSAAVAVG
jgi:methionine sulfoxide reductase heme-binding subunit